MNPKVVIIAVLIGLLFLLHNPAAMAAVPLPRSHFTTGFPIGWGDSTCKDKAHDSCDSKKCCECKFPTYGTCHNCCING
ncbi:hypothetical protein LINGRAHAP2_LOCUS33638 [Linum grandiflorum]